MESYLGLLRQLKPLTNPANMKEFLLGFLTETKVMKIHPTNIKQCEQQLTQLASGFAEVPNIVTPVSNFNQSITMLDNMVKLDRISSEVLEEGHFQDNCLNNNSTKIKAGFLKLVFYYDEIIKAKKDNDLVITMNLGLVAVSLTMGNYKSAGESLGSVVNLLLELPIHQSEEKTLENVNLFECFAAFQNNFSSRRAELAEKYGGITGGAIGKFDQSLEREIMKRVREQCMATASEFEGN